MKGLLIAVCGLDGSGKSTQIQKLENWFRNQQLPTLLTKQPTDYYRQDLRVREYLDNGQCGSMEALAMLVAADRIWHIKTLIEPSLKGGVSVISDRYLFSSLAYFSARGLDVQYVKQLNNGTLIPDLTVFLDVEPEILLQRISIRDGKTTKFEEREPTMFTKVREAFLNEVLPSNALIIDGTLSEEEIHKIIIGELNLIIKDKIIAT